MKTRIAIAALFAAAVFLTPAQATPILLTTTLPTPPHPPNPSLGSTMANLYLSGAGYPSGSSGYIVASGYDNLFPSSGTSKPKFSGATAVNLAVATDGGGVKGLGLASPSTDAPYVGPSDAIVLDLSHVNKSEGGAQISHVTFDLFKDITGGSYWMIYGVTGSGSTATYNLIASGQMLATGAMSVSTGAIYSSYIVGLGGDCAFDIRDVQVEYEAPEPGTFAMLGIGAVAVLVFRKRLTGRRG